MSNQALGIALCVIVLVICIVACIVDHEARQERRRKPNIRVPRETLWARTNRYHEDRS